MCISFGIQKFLQLRVIKAEMMCKALRNRLRGLLTPTMKLNFLKNRQK